MSSSSSDCRVAARRLLRAAAVLLSALAATGLAAAQHEPAAPGSPLFVAPRSDEGRLRVGALQLADGFVAELVAAEPDLCNGVSFAFDGQGRCFVVETFRIRDGVFDTRDYMAWKDEDLACLTVADRLAKYHRHLPDRIPGYAAFTERIRLLVDANRDGIYDRSSVFAAGFNELGDGIAAGVLPVGDAVLLTSIPRLWRLVDRDGDGVADERAVLHDGFGVHTSLIGHDLHGVVLGPDGRVYFSIGDRGFHVETPDGTLVYPHEGAVLRCELDGSGLEVVHRGLRNPQELAFDAHGDLFTADNNSDAGDRARLVQVVQGADSGWRIGFQWLEDRGAWCRERMWEPRHPEQAAAILPPIDNFADGPSGLCHDPGLGLPERFRDNFFLCDFRGGASNSGVRTFRLDRSGAGYTLASHDRLVWNVLATDCDFGPDGAFYVLDWVDGWSKTGKGRVYRLRTPEMANDLRLRAAARLLADDLTRRDRSQLVDLLSHPDRRVRQRAQFALAELGAGDALAAAAVARSSRPARLHGIWGLGMLARRGAIDLAALLELLGDADADVRAAAARAVGEVPAAARQGARALVALLGDHNPRVQREAALALARLRVPDDVAIPALFELVRRNDDHDAVVRHAAVEALAAIAGAADLLAHAADPRPAVQRAVLLALGRLRSAEVRRFLAHADEQFRFEAARLIYETPIDGALRDLALLAFDDVPDSVRVDWRAINANRLLGEVENGEALVHLATVAAHPPATRREALAVLAEWRAPHGQCRVTGNWRPCEHVRPELVARNFLGALDELLADAATAAAAARTAGALALVEAAPALAAAVADSGAPTDARVAALDALAVLAAPGLAAALDGIDASAPVALRHRAIELLSRTAPERAIPVLASLLADATLAERQAVCRALGDLQHPGAEAALSPWLDRVLAGDVEAALVLDIVEAAARHEALRPRVTAWEEAMTAQGPLGPFVACGDGGRVAAGRKLFREHEATRCTRCHALGGQGGNAGPALDGIGARLDRMQLVEALVLPSARIADGFGSTVVELHNGRIHAGVITRDQDGGITIVDITGGSVDIPWTAVKSRTANATSAMPAMGGVLTRQQIRDLVAFLAEQRQ